MSPSLPVLKPDIGLRVRTTLLQLRGGAENTSGISVDSQNRELQASDDRIYSACRGGHKRDDAARDSRSTSPPCSVKKNQRSTSQQPPGFLLCPLPRESHLPHSFSVQMAERIRPPSLASGSGRVGDASTASNTLRMQRIGRQHPARNNTPFDSLGSPGRIPM